MPEGLTAEQARTHVGTALALVEAAGEVLARLPAPASAFESEDPALFRFLSAAESALGWIVGQADGDSTDLPGPSSVLGDGRRIFEWTDEEAARHLCHLRHLRTARGDLERNG